MGEKNQNYYWLKVTEDKYELPLVVADTLFELSQIVGVKPTSISEMMARKNKEHCAYKKVPKEEYRNLEVENDRNM